MIIGHIYCLILLLIPGVMSFSSQPGLVRRTHQRIALPNLARARRRITWNYQHQCVPIFPYLPAKNGLTLKSTSKDGDTVSIAVSVSLVSITTSVLTLWSEASIFQTGCGPLVMPDLVERVSYQAVLAVSSLAWFIRLVFRQSLGTFAVDQGILKKDVRLLVNVAEATAYLAVFVAILVIFNQVQSDVDMTGLSGIDIPACKARRDFLLQR